MDSMNIINLFTLSLIWVKIYSNNPSTLEYTPPNVPVPNSNSISGIISLAVSDLKTSLHKSFSFVKFNYIIFPYLDISPVALTSVSLYPQNSQLKLIIKISLKWGIVTVHILFSPISLQTLQGVGIFIDSFLTESSIGEPKFYPPA